MPPEIQTIYRGELPTYLEPHVKKTGNFFESSLPSLVGKKFTSIWSDGVSRTPLQEPIPIEERVLPLPENVFVLSHSQTDNIGIALQNITEINKNDGDKIKDPKVRVKYQKRLAEIYEPIGELLKTNLNMRKALWLPPDNGAALPFSIMQYFGVVKKPENKVVYEEKRDYLLDGKPVVGIIETSYPEGDFETAIFLDDCLATDVSASASIDLIRELKKNKYPNIKNIIVVVSVATLSGLRALAQKYSDVKIIAGAVVYAMNSKNYLVRTTDELDIEGNPYTEDIQVVGDMGGWAGMLPEEFNDEAPWNASRKAKAA